nr:Rieske 2Fe-2S domain-containing protein [Legionella tunisiensis]
MVALQDFCPHRGAPLSAGKLNGEVLQCTYHGWRFNTSGDCIDIPGLAKINCANKRVPAYPIKIHFGLVFVCLEKMRIPYLFTTFLPYKQNNTTHICFN